MRSSANKMTKVMFVAYIEDIISSEPENVYSVESLWAATEDEFKVSFLLSNRILNDLENQFKSQ